MFIVNAMECVFDVLNLNNAGIGDSFNPITYGILTFRQLRGRGGGAFWPGSRKQGYD